MTSPIHQLRDALKPFTDNGPGGKYRTRPEDFDAAKAAYEATAGADDSVDWHQRTVHDLMRCYFYERSEGLLELMRKAQRVLEGVEHHAQPTPVDQTEARAAFSSWWVNQHTTPHLSSIPDEVLRAFIAGWELRPTPPSPAVYEPADAAECCIFGNGSGNRCVTHQTTWGSGPCPATVPRTGQPPPGDLPPTTITFPCVKDAKVRSAPPPPPPPLRVLTESKLAAVLEHVGGEDDPKFAARNVFEVATSLVLAKSGGSTPVEPPLVEVWNRREAAAAVDSIRQRGTDKPETQGVTDLPTGECSTQPPCPPPLDREEWTPQQALEFYAAGQHFDVVNGRTRILDTGAIASDALKQLSAEYAQMKGHTSSPVPRASRAEAEDAALWRALISCARVRVLGSAGIYRPNANGYMHIGVEFWTHHETPSDPSALEDLTNFATLAATRRTKSAGEL